MTTIRALCVGSLLFSLGAGCVTPAVPAPPPDEVANYANLRGGVATTLAPEAVRLSYDAEGSTWICTGALIAPRVVLTAGHCVLGATAWRITLAGENPPELAASAGEVFDYARDPMAAPDSTAVNFARNDVGLVYLDQPMRLDAYPPIARSPVQDYTRLSVVGRHHDGMESSTELYSTDPIYVRAQDEDEGRYYTLMDDRVQGGDSGGPQYFVYEQDGATRRVIVGVSSTMSKTARVDPLAQWILGKIADHGGGGAGAIDPPTPSTHVAAESCPAQGEFPIDVAWANTDSATTSTFGPERAVGLPDCQNGVDGGLAYGPCRGAFATGHAFLMAERYPFDGFMTTPHEEEWNVGASTRPATAIDLYVTWFADGIQSVRVTYDDMSTETVDAPVSTPGCPAMLRFPLVNAGRRSATKVLVLSTVGVPSMIDTLSAELGAAGEAPPETPVVPETPVAPETPDAPTDACGSRDAYGCCESDATVAPLGCDVGFYDCDSSRTWICREAEFEWSSGCGC